MIPDKIFRADITQKRSIMLRIASGSGAGNSFIIIIFFRPRIKIDSRYLLLAQRVGFRAVPIITRVVESEWIGTDPLSMLYRFKGCTSAISKIC